MPVLAPGKSRSYDFAPRSGTHWMHAHIPAQGIKPLAAPLIVRSLDDLAGDRQDAVRLLHDFSFKTGEEVLAEITGGNGTAGCRGWRGGSAAGRAAIWSGNGTAA